MNRTINYQIDKTAAGLRVEQFLKRKGYSSQNISSIKHMPESILLTGFPLTIFVCSLHAELTCFCFSANSL